MNPLTFKTTNSLLFPIKKTTSSSRTSNCHRGIRAVEQGYLLKHTTEKVYIVDPNRALIYLITCCKNLSSSQPANFTPQFQQSHGNRRHHSLWRQKVIHKRKKSEETHFIGICCPYPRKPSS